MLLIKLQFGKSNRFNNRQEYSTSKLFLMIQFNDLDFTEINFPIVL